MQDKFTSPESRYILPSFTERTSYGYREQNPYNKLFEDRIIFLGVQVDDASADDGDGGAWATLGRRRVSVV